MEVDAAVAVETLAVAVIVGLREAFKVPSVRITLAGGNNRGSTVLGGGKDRDLCVMVWSWEVSFLSEMGEDATIPRVAREIDVILMVKKHGG